MGEFGRPLNFHSVRFANMQMFIWFIKILLCGASDLPQCILLLCFYKYIQSLLDSLKNVPPGSRNFNRCLSKEQNFFCLLSFFLLPISFSSMQLIIWNMNRTLPAISIIWKQSFLGRKNFYPWIDTVCWDIMNELFNQDLPILQISEQD